MFRKKGQIGADNGVGDTLVMGAKGEECFVRGQGPSVSQAAEWAGKCKRDVGLTPDCLPSLVKSPPGLGVWGISGKDFIHILRWEGVRMSNSSTSQVISVQLKGQLLFGPSKSLPGPAPSL